MHRMWKQMVVLTVLGSVVSGARPDRVFPEGSAPPDKRLSTTRQLGDAYHPWVPPRTRDGWLRAARSIRKQLLVSNGLWPLPPRIALEPVLHGRIERDDYTIEKVYFASHPGHYVTGNLYRPKSLKGPAPGILCPHGHWPQGRFYDAGEKKSAEQVKKGAEKFLAGGRFPLQARMVHLARMGCVVFHYDMVGYADSRALPHRSGFGDVQATLGLQNLMGLQTFNSMRAIDFLETLPDVDPTRIAVTGASGGGTQTFMLCGLDPRPRAAFPAVMVSTGMQGGCVCENCCYLRQGINNIAIAALFAPRPMALSGANDWTIDIETKGLPELKHVYGLFGKASQVQAKCYPQYQHNYNQVAREMMYEWFNRHLELGHTPPLRERDFQPVPPGKLAVFDKEHPQPPDARTLMQYREYLSEVSASQFSRLLPDDDDDVREYRRVVGTAAAVMLGGIPMSAGEVKIMGQGEFEEGGSFETGTIGRRGTGEAIPFTLLHPEDPGRSLVVWFDGLSGKAGLFDKQGQPRPAVARLLSKGHTVVAADVFLTGELVSVGQPTTRVAVHNSFLGYTYGYNRPALTHRVQDVLTTMKTFSARIRPRRVHLVGTRGAGTWILLARAVQGRRRIKGMTVADINGFSFGGITRRDDPMLLPGALKYGGLGGLAALAAPSSLVIAGTRGVPVKELTPLKTVYRVTDEDLQILTESLSHQRVTEMLLDD